ncbi:hypothetical protein UlMin_031364 [Ulmus minor]
MKDHLETPKTTSKRSRPGLSSVDIYAAQCVKCMKWRIISTQEEFEEIRSKVKQEPFVCSRKPEVSCEDPADIEYDSSRTWVIDKPNVPKTPAGFKRSLVLRRDYSKMDVYYIAPSGKKMRTRNEIAAFLKDNPAYKDVSPEHFEFGGPKVMEDTLPPDVVLKKRSASSTSSNRKTKKEVADL